MSGTLFIREDSVWMPESESYRRVMKTLSRVVADIEPQLAERIDIEVEGEHISIEDATRIEMAALYESIILEIEQFIKKENPIEQQCPQNHTDLYRLVELLSLISNDRRLDGINKDVEVFTANNHIVVVHNFFVWLFLTCCALISGESCKYGDFLLECLERPDYFTNLIQSIPINLQTEALTWLCERYREGGDINDPLFITVIRDDIIKLKQ